MKRARELAILLTLSLLIFVAASELVLRIYLNRNISFDVEMGRYARLLEVPAKNPLIRHRQLPNADLRLMGVPVRTNSAGFRDDDVELTPDERHRVIFLGDSLLFGWGVQREHTFATLLEQKLSKGRPTEVINFGHVNYNTVQQVNLLIDEGLAYEPDQVVLFYFINDAEPVPPPSNPSWLGSLRVATFYGSRLNALKAQLVDTANYQGHYAAFYRPDAPGWLAAEDALALLASTCREHGIALQVVLLPELHELARYPFAAEHALVAERLREHDIPFLDLAPAFANEQDPSTLWVAPDDAHPNARGHALIAAHAAQFIAEGFAAPGVKP